MERFRSEEHAMLSSSASIQHLPEHCVGARKMRWAVGSSCRVAPGGEESERGQRSQGEMGPLGSEEDVRTW